MAVVGVGYLGKFHAEKYAASAKAELIGVVDVDGAPFRYGKPGFRNAGFVATGGYDPAPLRAFLP